ESCLTATPTSPLNCVPVIAGRKNGRPILDSHTSSAVGCERTQPRTGPPTTRLHVPCYACLALCDPVARRWSVCMQAWYPLLLSSLLAGQPADIKPVPLGARLDEFELRDYRGATRKLSDWRDSRLVAVVFLGVDCPLAKLYAGRLND